MTNPINTQPKKQKRRRTPTARKKSIKNPLPKAFQRNWGLYLVGVTVLASMDAFSAGVISLTNPITFSLFGKSIHLAIFEVAFCFGAGLLAFIGGTAIAEWKNDPRPGQTARILGARLLIVAILTIGPVPYFAKALTYVDRHGAWTEYHGSEQMKVDAPMVANPLAYPEDAAAAAAKRFEASVEPKHAAMNPVWFVVAWLMYGAAVFAAEVFFVVAPETAGQRKARVTAARRAELKADREAERRTAEEKAEAERKRAQSFKAVIIDLFTGKRREAA